jgi:hypothetical protein
MKICLVAGIAGMLACGLDAAESFTDQLNTAAKKLEGQSGYSWITTTKESDGSPGKLSPINGKSDTNHVMYLTMTPGGIPVEVYLKGEKGSARALEGWQTLDDIAKAGGSAAAIVRYLKLYQAPAVQVASLTAKATDLALADGVITGELKEEATKELLLMGTRRRDGEDPPKIANAKGSVQFWLKEGALSKYEINVQGKVTAGDRATDINRTLTTEIKDAGATTFEIPAEAKEKMT